jgi:hypothetical protein
VNSKSIHLEGIVKCTNISVITAVDGAEGVKKQRLFPIESGCLDSYTKAEDTSKQEVKVTL